MAYMNQEKKAVMAPAIKAVLKKYGMTGTLSVNNLSTLVLTISKGPLDVFSDYTVDPARTDYIQVNEFWYKTHFTGKTLEFLLELIPVMMVGNHDNSDSQSDYFDVGFYISISFGRWNKPFKII
jgi:hypothetical protein